MHLIFAFCCCLNNTHTCYRPGFPEILDRLDEALINISIKDEKGQEMWKAMKNKVCFSILRAFPC